MQRHHFYAFKADVRESSLKSSSLGGKHQAWPEVPPEKVECRVFSRGKAVGGSYGSVKLPRRTCKPKANSACSMLFPERIATRRSADKFRQSSDWAILRTRVSASKYVTARHAPAESRCARNVLPGARAAQYSNFSVMLCVELSISDPQLT